ncbi:MAG: hypothetical protein JSU88_11385 [Nitrospinaceae bacterium]|jgi:hypothetical protein|nr:MAG: hypothetical protein JSU88_11385 [Nitrospinaceae bacterium]
MFYDVKVFDPQGNLKQVIRGRKLAHDHWNKFKEAEEQNNFVRLDRERVYQELRNCYHNPFASRRNLGEEKELQEN